ncbi:MAG: Two-component response regulator [Parcubacteria group bacterium GW2011_GWA2_47_26]|nr:MAG: Two-component response regulator [Parcubacteria group bacterium GW2011_GWA2_47_26]
MPNNKTRILLVEDDTFLAGIYAHKFEAEGFEVLLATDGEAGAKVAAKELPNIILLDILLPKMDGFEVLEKVKGDAKTKNIPVILLTNLGQKEDVDKGLKLGASDYLIKAHFMPQETVEKVKKVLAANPARSGK